MVRIHTSDGIVGTGYSYTIGTGGSSVVALLRDHLAPRLLGRDPLDIEAIWKSLFFAPMRPRSAPSPALRSPPSIPPCGTSKCLAAGRPLWKEAGGAQAAVPVYSTEGGWLHVEPQALVDDALAVKAQGFGGAKIKVGRPHVSEDIARLAAVREAVGPGFEIMVDANQAFTVAEAIRRARAIRAARSGLVRGAAAGGGPRRPHPACGLNVGSDCGRASRSITRAIFANICSATPARSCRPTSRASAASRPGSRSRTSPRPSTCRSVRIS